MTRPLDRSPYHRTTRTRVLASTLHRVRAVQRLGIFVGGLFAYLVAVAGCYDPALTDCTVQCSSASDCTGGQVCRGDGWCAMPNASECARQDANENDAVIDAAIGSPDAPIDQAACHQACTNGTCVNGVCVIDCTAAYSCPEDLKCPANVPCRVVCGDHACAKKVYCELSSSCEVQCNGEGACGDEILCNTNRCDVDCVGAGSCKRRTKCSNACACDVTCTGIGSCVEVSECPDSTCRLGNGCSSLLAGCDSC